MKIFVANYGFNNQLAEARPLVDEEKKSYLPEYADSILVGTGHSVELPLVSRADIPLIWWRSRKIWSLPGNGNQAIEISDQEWDELIALNSKRQTEKDELARQNATAHYRQIITIAEKQQDIPTPAEASRRRKLWIDAQNEGAEGYVPQIIDTEIYEDAKKHLAELECK